MTEKQLVIELKNQLEPRFEKVWIHKKPSASKWFRNEVQKAMGKIPLLQPEFDIIVKTKNDELNAIEVKYLTKFKKGYNLPFYRGIGQALALTRFGFNHVGLWFLIDAKINAEVVNKYGAQAWWFVRNELILPLDYSYFKITEKGGKVSFIVMQYYSDNEGSELCDLTSPGFKITWKYPNPLRSMTKSIKLREIVEEYLAR